jgi:hypothetical protein
MIMRLQQIAGLHPLLFDLSLIRGFGLPSSIYYLLVCCADDRLEPCAYKFQSLPGVFVERAFVLPQAVAKFIT